MAFKYNEDEIIVLTVDYPGAGLRRGDRGKIWALYEIELPHYEATFRADNGDLVDLTVSEEEIAAPDFVEAYKGEGQLAGMGLHLENLKNLTLKAPEGERSVESILDEIAARIPDEELAKLPVDLSEQSDHYVYGTPKQ